MVDIQEVASAIASSGPSGLRLRQGVVVSVQAGSVTLTIGGSSSSVPGVKYLSSYSPTAADVVWMLSDGRTIIVLGKLA